jgi:ABC-2 type transport system permease protein
MTTLSTRGPVEGRVAPRGRGPLSVIVAGTWRAWWRDALAQSVLLLLAVLIVASAALQFAAATTEAGHRATHQQEADAAFAEQPDRHPHRMVHYGHYVFRTAAPLAVLEPGVDAFTGRSIFLEGHRRNTPTFSEAREASLLARFGDLSPAFVLQVLVPLVLVLLGAGAVAGERERGTALILLAQGLKPATLLQGKAVALGMVALLALLPPGLVGVSLVLGGAETPAPVALLTLSHLLYLLGWCALVVAVSARCRRRSDALVGLFVLWGLLVIVAPRLATELTATSLALPSRAEVQIETAVALREVGDAHNEADPAFARFRQEILDRYGATRIEDLPVNWRGLVAERGEADGKRVLDRFAEARLEREAAQSERLARFAWASPLLAIREVSTAAAGTDLAQHHRFLRAAEAHRFEVVQRLNRLQAEAMTYADDVNRNADPEAGRRARVAAENWRQIPRFEFRIAPAAERSRAALAHVGPLLLWCVLGALLLARAGRAESLA